jgi:hypothetical protein
MKPIPMKTKTKKDFQKKEFDFDQTGTFKLLTYCSKKRKKWRELTFVVPQEIW